MKATVPAILAIAAAGSFAIASAHGQDDTLSGGGGRAPTAPLSANLERPTDRDETGAVRETVTTARVKAALEGDPAMDGHGISVSTDDGVVTLSGTARSEDQVTLATQLAQRQEGVRAVETQVAVE